MVRRNDVNRVDVLAVDQFAEIGMGFALVFAAQLLRVMPVDLSLGLFNAFLVDVADGHDLLIVVGEHPVEIPAGPVASAADQPH